MYRINSEYMLLIYIIFSIYMTNLFPVCFQPLKNGVQSSSGIIVYGDSWNVTSACGMETAIFWLQTTQPRILHIDIPTDVPTPLALKRLCQIVQKYFAGTLMLQLWSSYLNYEDCSEMIETLAKAR